MTDDSLTPVTRAIFALNNPAPSGSEHYRAGWGDALDAAIDAARDALDSETRYTVNLEFPGTWPVNSAIELLPSEIPRKGELIGWTTEPVRDSVLLEPRTKFLRFRVADAMWCLNPTTNTDREVYLTLELEEN